MLRLLDPLQVPRNLNALGLSERDVSILRRLGVVTGHLVLSTIESTWGADPANFA